MDERYTDPQVTALWGLPWTYQAWWRIEQAVTRAQINLGLVDQPDAQVLISDEQPDLGNTWTLVGIAAYEAVDKHDVAAFVRFMRDFYGEPHARWLHFGLTSSDLVDTAQGLRFAAMRPALRSATYSLDAALQRWHTDETVILGRTHGQVAEPTAMKVRAAHWQALVSSAMRRLHIDTMMMATAKIAGPVGTYAHNPPEVESAVAAELRLIPQMHGASQIVPRGNLARWANSAAELIHACAKIAMDFRLMNLLGEAYEPQDEGQVGSSSMPGKNNPIRAEQITGMQRLAAGYASVLQPVDMWLERDISNSAVERIVVPDLWHVLLHVIEQTTRLLADMRLDTKLIKIHLEDGANAAYAAASTLAAIRDGMPYQEAREFGAEAQIESYSIEDDMRDNFLGNYPWKQRTDERA